MYVQGERYERDEETRRSGLERDLPETCRHETRMETETETETDGKPHVRASSDDGRKRCGGKRHDDGGAGEPIQHARMMMRV